MSNERKTLQSGLPKKEIQVFASTLIGVSCSPNGNPIMPVYKRIYVKELDKSLVRKVDTFNLQEFIDASRSQTDLAILQKRFNELGEIPAMSPDMGSNDLVGMPSDIHEVYAMAQDVAGNFNRLPESVRQVFGTKEAYLKALMNGTYQATLVNAFNQLPKSVSKKVEEKKEEEGK